MFTYTYTIIYDTLFYHVSHIYVTSIPYFNSIINNIIYSFSPTLEGFGSACNLHCHYALTIHSNSNNAWQQQCNLSPAVITVYCTRNNLLLLQHYYTPYTILLLRPSFRYHGNCRKFTHTYSWDTCRGSHPSLLPFCIALHPLPLIPLCTP